MISIIIPVYNTERFLSQCLDSIIAQTYNDFEVLLIDDGSTDSSGSICDEYALADFRFRVFHQINAGVSAARNFGIEHVTGDFIYFMDSDDLIHPQLLEILHNTIISDDYDFAMIYGKSVPENYLLKDGLYDISSLRTKSIDSHYCVRKLFGSKPIRTWYRTIWTKLYRTEFIRTFSFRDTASEDTEFNCRIYLNMRKAVLVEKELYYWIQNKASLTHSAINENRIGYIDSHVMCLNEIPYSKKVLRSYCLVALYKTMLAIRYLCRDTEYRELAEQRLATIHHRFGREFLHSKANISDKMSLLSLFYMPNLLPIALRLKEKIRGSS